VRILSSRTTHHSPLDQRRISTITGHAVGTHCYPPPTSAAPYQRACINSHPCTRTRWIHDLSANQATLSSHRPLPKGPDPPQRALTIAAFTSLIMSLYSIPHFRPPQPQLLPQLHSRVIASQLSASICSRRHPINFSAIKHAVWHIPEDTPSPYLHRVVINSFPRFPASRYAKRPRKPPQAL